MGTPKCHLLPQKRKVKTLGEEEPWLDDAAAWIERSRALQREKELAEKRVGRDPKIPRKLQNLRKPQIPLISVQKLWFYINFYPFYCRNLDFYRIFGGICPPKILISPRISGIVKLPENSG